MLVITGSSGAVSLQFKHQDDPTAAIHPDVSGVTGATVVKRFLCPSPVMALVWAAAPAAPYRVSVLPITAPEF